MTQAERNTTDEGRAADSADSVTTAVEADFEGHQADGERPLVSVVVPLYNEAESLGLLHAEISQVMQKWQRSYEVVYVDDGSRDETPDKLAAIVVEDHHVRVVEFRRNFGQTAALSAGIDHARGKIIVPMDGDLQNDPADIPSLVAKLDAGFDVVSGWRQRRQDSMGRRIVSMTANRLISWVSGVHLHDYGCTLKAYRREVIEDVRLYGEMHRFVPIFAKMQGGRVTEMVVQHRPRRFGKSKYGFGRIYKVLLDLFLVRFLMSYSAKPNYLFGGFGFICLLLSMLTIALSVVFKVVPESTGWQKDFVETPLPVVAAVGVLVGFLALLQGLQAEMLMRTYFESQDKPTYLVKRVLAAETRAAACPTTKRGE